MLHASCLDLTAPTES